jgi:hypothetical protein
MRAPLVILLVVAAAVAAAPGRAVAGDKAAAEAAFQQGKDLMKTRRYDAACSAFEKSQALDPQLGTEYNLASCYEQAGRLASAWAEFRELAQRDTNAARKLDSEKRAAALQPRLIKLLINVRQPVRGLTVTRNDEDSSQLVGIETPIDPGEYVIGARADGYLPWSVKVAATQEGGTVQVTVPELARAPEAPIPPAEDTRRPRPTELVRDGSGRRRLGLYVGGGGVAIAAGGAVLGYLASRKWSHVKALCGDPAACTATGDDLDAARADQRSATSLGDLSTIALGVGGAAIVTGVIVYLTAPAGGHAEHASLHLAPTLTPDGVAVTAIGSF